MKKKMSDVGKSFSKICTIPVSTLAASSIKSALDFEIEFEQISKLNTEHLSGFSVSAEDAAEPFRKVLALMEPEKKSAGEKRNGSLSRQQAFGGLFENKH